MPPLPLGSFQSPSEDAHPHFSNVDPKLLFPTGSGTSSWQSWHMYSLLPRSSCLASCTALSLIETNMITEASLGCIWLFGCCFRNGDFYSPKRQVLFSEWRSAVQTQVCDWASSKEILSFALSSPDFGCTDRFSGLHLEGRAGNLLHGSWLFLNPFAVCMHLIVFCWQTHTVQHQILTHTCCCPGGFVERAVLQLLHFPPLKLTVTYCVELLGEGEQSSLQHIPSITTCSARWFLFCRDLDMSLLLT